MEVFVVVAGEYTSPSNNLIGIYLTMGSAIKAQNEALSRGIITDIVKCLIKE